MKRIAVISFIVILFFITMICNCHADPGEEVDLSVSAADINVIEKDDMAVFTISSISHEDKAASIAPYLTRYYFDDGGFRDVFFLIFFCILKNYKYQV
jgi:hypothetical protein